MMFLGGVSSNSSYSNCCACKQLILRLQHAAIFPVLLHYSGGIYSWTEKISEFDRSAQRRQKSNLLHSIL